MNNRSPISVDYTEEDMSKVLDLDSLIEAIHEYFAPTTEHDFEYLQKRIELLRATFNLATPANSEGAKVVERLLSGYGQLPSLQILPLESALEVPESIEIEVVDDINQRFEADLDQIKEIYRRVQREYLRCIITRVVEDNYRLKKIQLSEVVARGLPKYEPSNDPLDY